MSVRHAILGLLAEHPRHGYELHRAFGSLFGEADPGVKPAQVYTTLARLEEAGLAAHASTEQGAGPEKRIYDITDEGRAELNRWFSEGVSDARSRDEFFVKLMTAVNGGQADPRRVLQTQRTTLYRDLHSITAHRNRLDPKRQLATILLLDKAAMHLEADLRWLEMIEARLDDVRRQPPPPAEPARRGRPPKRAQLDPSEEARDGARETSEGSGATAAPRQKDGTWR